MSSEFGRRFGRAVAAVACLAFLTAARTAVVPLPETVIPKESEHPLREPFTVRKGDVVLRGEILETEIVTVDAPISVAIAKFTDNVAAGTRLEPVLASQRTERLTGTDGRMYCGENQRTRSKFGEYMIGNWFSKYDTEVRFCFVDGDGDRRLDRVFLSGAKDKAEQGAIPIEPVPYTVRMMQPDDTHGEFELRVEKFKPETNQMTMRLYLRRNGQDASYSYVFTVDALGGHQTYPEFKTNPRKKPYPVVFSDILGAEVEVMSVDAAQGTAQVKVNRPIRMQMFKPISITYQYIFIYY
ncbi:hypothetical protein [Novosphingobium taihuense]|uniref:Uncharacterized protein n=1 Tax=Novosphingobium taihuense TaxID=260085 RepID=A0A7W7AA95_9SPHN|nr:hypothetical protein [Novosphingobium taihuense]MBB4612522.1 hypothetical protein [Novosphingobium taihuense]TWH88126.1 hypothetical protein IQ25_00241 [Novosphingobium taihuense]